MVLFPNLLRQSLYVTNTSARGVAYFVFYSASRGVPQYVSVWRDLCC